MRKLAFASALAFALTGCDGAHLKELTFAEISLNKESMMEFHPELGAVDVVLVAGVEGDSCPTLSSDTRATLNDIPLTTRSLGEVVHGFMSGFCRSPTFELRTSREEVVRLLSSPSLMLKVMDGESTRVVEVGSLCGPRSLRVVKPADGLLREGETVELQWEPATDQLVPMLLSFKDEGGQWLTHTYADVFSPRVSLTVPPRPDSTGQVVLQPTAVASIDPPFKVPVKRCDFDRCDMRCGLPVPIQPLEVHWAP